MLNYSELIKQRRSIRDFKQDKISFDVLHEIIKDTCLAPSSSNRQPWKFIIIQNQEVMKKLSNESKKNLVSEIEKDRTSSFSKYEKNLRNPDFNVFYNAPCLILIVGKNDHSYFYQNGALAASYLMFAATTRGLGTCWIGLGDKIKDPALKKEIGMPEDHEILAPLIIGYPKVITTEVSRNAPVILKEIE